MNVGPLRISSELPSALFSIPRFWSLEIVRHLVLVSILKEKQLWHVTKLSLCYFDEQLFTPSIVVLFLKRKNDMVNHAIIIVT